MSGLPISGSVPPGTTPRVAGCDPRPRGSFPRDEARRTPDMLDMVADRHRMVDNQVAGRGVGNQAVLDAMHEVPREAFVDPGFEEFAYADAPLPIGEAQTISQP